MKRILPLLLSGLIYASSFRTVEAESQGTKPCGPHQVIKDEGYECTTCETLKKGLLAKCAPVKERKCYCEDNFVKNNYTSSECVNVEECKLIKCRDNEEVRDEGAECETCEMRKNGILASCLLIKEIKCYCISGYIRKNSDKDSECVNISECPLGCPN